MSGFFKTYKFEILVQALLILAAAFFLFYNSNRPLADYDEATYAKVVVDTMHSGNFTTLQLSGADWFLKPPLYFWLTMGSVKIFGTQEFAFRLPSILLSIICLWLVYLLMRYLSKSVLISAATFLILLFSPPFLVFSMEARLDSGVIAAILAALYFCIRGWNEERFLLAVFPVIAIGFMFKSVIVFLIFPIVVIYCLAYKQWAWIKNKFLWIGLAASVIILAPWHIVESIKFGRTFWDSYLVHEVFQRSVSTLTGTSNPFDYIYILWMYYRPWFFVIPALLLGLIGIRRFDKGDTRIHWEEIFAPLVCAVLIVILFTIPRTHLSTYILPAFPFFAMFMGLSIYNLSNIFKSRGKAIILFSLLAAVSLIWGGIKGFASIADLIPAPTAEEKIVGQTYAGYQKQIAAPLYVWVWPYLESLAYYGNTQAHYIDSNGGTLIKGPSYIVTTTGLVKYLFKDSNTPQPGLESLKIVNVGNYFVLMFARGDVRMPQINLNPDSRS